MDALSRIEAAGYRYYFASFSALDRYFRAPTSQTRNVYVAFDGTLIELAKALGELDYPGLEDWDAASAHGEGMVYVRCLSDEYPRRRLSFHLLDFLYDPAADTFFDPRDAYRELRSSAPPTISEAASALDTITAGAVLAARYGYEITAADLPDPDFSQPVSPAGERQLLVDLLGGQDPARGLRILHDTGFVAHVWPELAPMNGTDHSKEHHPEGNVWEHSLETLRYRKVPDLLLSLGLLFHDSGKPTAEETREHAFDGHAQIGADIAREFLRERGFSEQLVSDVRWLVVNHMFPGALHKLPQYRTETLMSSRLFPVLLELYRCDLSSTFRGPDGYYRACRIYRSFLKNVSNPFRDAAGKKLVKLYVE
ncbi:MAG: HD domain-containing protein [Spirochaetota bacterium]